MSHLNVEFKARCEDASKIRAVLSKHNAVYKGEDRQKDTYFNVTRGRLKLREGILENCLIYYERNNQEGPKQSNVSLFAVQQGTALKELLAKSLGVKVVVEKRREIYFHGNVKFHIDDVEGLGSFVEVEAIDLSGTLGRERLEQQCHQYLREFGISRSQLVSNSYSDLLLQAQRIN
jgi:adenylate cyclase class 2